jgi:hypothetical protein
MKTNLTYSTSLVLLILIIFSGCHSNSNPDKKDTVIKTTTTNTVVTQIAPKQNIAEDSILLTNLVKNLYKWHATQKLKYDGFRPIKLNPADTLFKAIDLEENQKAINELKTTGLFADDFLKDYRNIAVRMDEELRDGSSLWVEGDLPTFNDDVDEWCNCQDEPADDYWSIIKIKDISINSNHAQFKWTWGDNFAYDVKAVNENGNWKISYLQGFDMKAYNWGWWKENKDKIKK